MAEAWLPLGRFIGKLDFSGTAPPWPLLVWNPTTAAWEAVGSEAAPALASDKKIRTSGDITGLVSTTFAALDTALNITLTTGARRCLVSWVVMGKNSTTDQMCLDLAIDGTRQGGDYGLVLPGSIYPEINLPFVGSYLSDVLTAGSHIFELQMRVDGGSATVYASSAVSPVVFSVMEQSS